MQFSRLRASVFAAVFLAASAGARAKEATPDIKMVENQNDRREGGQVGAVGEGYEDSQGEGRFGGGYNGGVYNGGGYYGGGGMGGVYENGAYGVGGYHAGSGGGFGQDGSIKAFPMGALAVVPLDTVNTGEIDELVTSLLKADLPEQERLTKFTRFMEIRSALLVRDIQKRQTDHEKKLDAHLAKSSERFRPSVLDTTKSYEARNFWLQIVMTNKSWSVEEYQKLLHEAYPEKAGRNRDTMVFRMTLNAMLSMNVNQPALKAALESEMDYLLKYHLETDESGPVQLLSFDPQIQKEAFARVVDKARIEASRFRNPIQFLRQALPFTPDAKGLAHFALEQFRSLTLDEELYRPEHQFEYAQALSSIHPFVPLETTPQLLEIAEQMEDSYAISGILETLGKNPGVEIGEKEEVRIEALLRKDDLLRLEKIGERPRFQKIYLERLLDAYRENNFAGSYFDNIHWTDAKAEEFFHQIEKIDFLKNVSKMSNGLRPFRAVQQLPYARAFLKKMHGFLATPEADPKKLSPAQRGEILVALERLSKMLPLDGKVARYLASLIKSSDVSDGEKQTALEILASSEKHFENEMASDKKLVQAVITGATDVGFLRNLLSVNGPEDRSLVRAGIRIQDLINSEKISKTPLCARICDLAQKVKDMGTGPAAYSNGIKDPETFGTAVENLRMLFLFKAAKMCQKSTDLGQKAIDIFFKSQNLEVAPPPNGEGWQKKQMKVNGLQGVEQLYAQGIYARQFMMSLIRDTGATTKQRDVAKEAALSLLKEIDVGRVNKTSRDGGSYLNAYAYTTSFLHLLNYPEVFSEAALGRVRSRLVEVSDRLQNSGDSMKLPYSIFAIPGEDNEGSEEGSYGRNVTFYLGLYMSARTDEDKGKYRDLLQRAVKVYLKEFPDALLYGKTHGTHTGKYARAPYYFFGTIPYLGSALKMLSEDPKADKDFIAESQKLVTQALLSNFGDDGYYSAGENDSSLSPAAALPNRARVYNNALIGLSLVSLGDSCLNTSFDRGRNYGILGSPLPSAAQLPAVALPETHTE